MGRQDYERVKILPYKGINQQVDLAIPQECSDARNIWAPTGRLEQRPGILPIPVKLHGTTVATASENATMIWYDASTTNYDSQTGTGSFAWADVDIGDYIYLQFTDAQFAYARDEYGTHFRIVELDFAQNLDSRPKVEYYDGSTWRWLPALYYSGTTYKYGNRLFSETANSHGFYFSFPLGWQKTTINSTEAYYIRVTVINSDFQASVPSSTGASGRTVVIRPAAAPDGTRPPCRHMAMFSCQFLSTKRYIRIAQVIRQVGATVTLQYLYTSTSSLETESDHVEYNRDTGVLLNIPPALPSIAVVQQFDEAFVAFDHFVSRHPAYPVSGDTLQAQVESRDWAVGSKAPYDKEYIVQLSEFPRAHFITFFKGRLWASNLEGEPTSVRWSVPVPYHKVWPQISSEPIIETDNSPITGQAPLGEYLVVFKNDSIWQMIPTEQDHFGLATFVPTKVPSGVGCVSNASIQEIKGRLVFLAEDGIYLFDGSEAVKISDRIQETIDSIVPSLRSQAVSVHWKKKNCYLLSVGIGNTSINNHIIVWDYKNDALWVWDTWEAMAWLRDEDSFDNEHIYYGAENGSEYKIDIGNDDAGQAISSYFTTHRVGYADSDSMIVRSIELTSDNTSGNPTVELIVDDEASGTSGTLDLDDYNEAKYDTAVYGTDTYSKSGRRTKRLSFRECADWFQVKVSHSNAHEPFKCSMVEEGFVPKGKR